MGSSHGPLETSFRATMWMMRGMATERCAGLMDQLIRGSGTRGSSTVMERCTSQMEQVRSAFLKTMSSKETSSRLHQEEESVDQVPKRQGTELIRYLPRGT